MNGLVRIENDGPRLASTDYFDNEHARRGFFFASWNAGALRLLVPDVRLGMVDEMRTGTLCVVTRGSLEGLPALELMWDDGSDSPFAVHVDQRQADRLVPVAGDPKIQVAAYGRAGLLAEWPGRYRSAPRLPYLAPWHGK
jgi:hypothetical protein